MPAALLRGRWRRVTLQKPTRTADALGGAAVTWATVASVWARFVPAPGREIVQAQALQGRAPQEVRLRYRDGVTADMRLVDGTQTFALQAPPRDPDGRHAELILLVEEGAPA